jgi:hypothetical protein
MIKWAINFVDELAAWAFGALMVLLVTIAVSLALIVLLALSPFMWLWKQTARGIEK